MSEKPAKVFFVVNVRTNYLFAAFTTHEHALAFLLHQETTCPVFAGLLMVRSMSLDTALEFTKPLSQGGKNG